MTSGLCVGWRSCPLEVVKKILTARRVQRHRRSVGPVDQSVRRGWDHGAIEQLRPPARWSSAVEDADWIAERLGPFGAGVTSVVPAGFEAYARILHPAEEPATTGRLVRWREISAWSGVALCPDAQFHTVALPIERPDAQAPWRGQGPPVGRLYLPDADALSEILRIFTTTPEECFFGLWDGYGFGRVPLVSQGLPPAVPFPDPIPTAVRQGPLVRLPDREYLLFSGPVEAITATADIGHGQTANLAWPADHAWCVASEIDLAWTYVGGSKALIEQVRVDERVEALLAEPADPLARIEPFVAELGERAVEELLDGGHTVITTSMGTVEGWLERPTRWRAGALRVRAEHDDGCMSSSGGPLHHGEDLRREAVFRLTEGVVSLVGG